MVSRSTVALLFGVAMITGTPRANAPEIVIRHAEISTIEEVYRLDAYVDYNLTKPVKEALRNGVKLFFSFKIGVVKQRFLLPDDTVAELEQSYRLEYHALSQQYLVENLNTGIQETFTDLASALDYQGQVVNLPLIDRSLIEPDRDYLCLLRAGLDLDQLPLPLRIGGYLSSSWRLNTDWYTLSLR